MTDVINPSPVPIRLRRTDITTYGTLARILRAAADLAEAERYEAALAGPGGANGDMSRQQREAVHDLRDVRDALRTAAIEALVPRGGTGRPRCRRCGIDCPSCSPPADRGNGPTAHLHDGPPAESLDVQVDVFVSNLLGHRIGCGCPSCEQARAVCFKAQVQP